MNHIKINQLIVTNRLPITSLQSDVFKCLNQSCLQLLKSTKAFNLQFYETEKLQILTSDKLESATISPLLLVKWLD